MDKRQSGREAERAACRYLQTQGLKLREMNYQPRNTGEIDIIMQDNDCLVFVEVKARASDTHGDSIEMISAYKQNLLRRTALTYLLEENLFEKMPCRFDVIGIDGDNITWLKNAIETTY